MSNDSGVIHEENLCPCGSGNRYGECCAKEGITYGFFEVSGKRIVFNVKEVNNHVRSLACFLNEKIIDPYNKKITISMETALGIIGGLYEILGSCLEPFQLNSSCKMGCNACCRHIIGTTAIEAQMVQRFVERTFGSEDKRRLASSIEKDLNRYPDPVPFQLEYSDHIQDEFFKRHAPCPFLSRGGLCGVYEARPLVCRMYLVFSDPILCKGGKEMAAYDAEYFLDVHRAVECLSLIVFQALDYSRHLPDWFANEFKENS